MKRNAASQAQLRAAEPTASTWLSANAGSGKTRVLTDRVARLLLRGTEPHKILCLTYTKAAAAEMQNRLLERLGTWAMLNEEDLRKELWLLGEEGEIPPENLREARRLFAKAIETPGGLKIQTIHSFCASLLRRFPLEAGVSHGFKEMDDRSGALLRSEIVDEMAGQGDTSVLDAMAPYLPEKDLDQFLQTLARHHALFAKPLDLAGSRALFGLAPDTSCEGLIAQTLPASDIDMLQKLAPILAKGGATDIKLGDTFARLKAHDLASYLRLEAALLFGPTAAVPYGAKVDKIPTKALREGAASAFMPELNDLMERMMAARPERLAILASDQTYLLHRFADAFLPKYRMRKAARGWLDFDDLIERAGSLLSDSSVAQWVLFRLDGGIDHILVDEAQDTSPAQWKVIEALADEFTAGESARDIGRTLFVVGDKKQSIYSFQGADLSAFGRMETHFSERYAALGVPMQSLDLAYSFRSSPAVLNLVDQTFDERVRHGIGGEAKHIAFFGDMPGRVDLWPAISKPESADADENWEDPRDLRGENDENVVLAGRIADEIKRMIDTGVQIPDGAGARAVNEGDFLILVQRRKALFDEIIRACKTRGLAIAGADRLKLGAELAVRDIGALIAFLVTTDDDLSLAEALRSPLFGWSEDALFRLAQPRKGRLWAALRADESHTETRAILSDLLDGADFLRPYELIERLLVHHGGRERLIARLGREAEEGIDELLSQALKFEQSEIPSLTGFLSWLSSGDVEVKRQMDGEGAAIRVMTVHGAKGLEAPIVILPETQDRKNPNASPLVEFGGSIVMAASRDRVPQAQAIVQAEQVERSVEERLRLLYVALTRAEKWLIVCGAGKITEGSQSWYALVKDAMAKSGAVLSELSSDMGEILRAEFGVWPADGVPRSTQSQSIADLFPWAQTQAPRGKEPEKILSPSDLGGLKVVLGSSSNSEQTHDALLRGTLIHAVIEAVFHLPSDAWEAATESVMHAFGDVPPDMWEGVKAEAFRTASCSQLDPYRGADTFAEVAFTARLEALGDALINGTIDLLKVDPDAVKLVDFKSNAVVPDNPADVPVGILRQMGAYQAAIKQIYPDRDVVVEIYWTANNTLMRLDGAQVDAALRLATAS